MERLKVAMTPPCLRSPGRTFLFTEVFLFSSCFAKTFYLLLLWATVDHSAFFFFLVLASRMQVYYPWYKKNLKLFIPLPNCRGLGGLITFHCISSKAPQKDEKKKSVHVFVKLHFRQTWNTPKNMIGCFQMPGKNCTIKTKKQQVSHHNKKKAVVLDKNVSKQ